VASIETKIASAVLSRIRKQREREPSQPDLVYSHTRPLPKAKVREARLSDFDGVAELKQRGGSGGGFYRKLAAFMGR